jgi:hypothetical protein
MLAVIEHFRSSLENQEDIQSDYLSYYINIISDFFGQSQEIFFSILESEYPSMINDII